MSADSRRVLRDWLADMRAAARIIASRDFRDAFAAYWGPEAVSARMRNWAERARQSNR